MMTPAIEKKLGKLRAIMHECGSVLVAYSGGVDSALVMAVAHQELGDRALACIGVSPSYPAREMRDAVKLAEELGVPYRLVNTEEYLDPNYAANPNNRCYFCKSELHNRLKAILVREEWGVVLDGNNASDVGDFRPGMTAARERGVRSPLLEAAISKEEVRTIAQSLGLPVWDKPAMACLSSRVPHGTPITPELLRQIEAAEDVLVALGFAQFRVRHHNEVARIELPPEDFPKAIAAHMAITNGVKAAGYRFVALDLAGFRSGSLNGANGTAIPLV
ncbi:MAG: ATP-dependent sacrificial sulfur transferase LarE, partial [Caldilineaceae bacterium]|nr:ATP-dependent sacrificial sulfur transferase LarE [Caldilineaceae bacterium]